MSLWGREKARVKFEPAKLDARGVALTVPGFALPPITPAEATARLESFVASCSGGAYAEDHAMLHIAQALAVLSVAGKR